AHATDIQTNSVVLGSLDKVSGRVNTLEGGIGQPMTFGNLQIVARTCVTHPPEEKPENAAFLEVSQVEPKAAPKPAKKARVKKAARPRSRCLQAPSPRLPDIGHLLGRARRPSRSRRLRLPSRPRRPGPRPSTRLPRT
ncbi:MAG: DUF2155 domain-containing protein, partial [Gemmatimonadetes bacterium]|nr:DUF2155 domain-containing protein [Gemmatimonadota bacterium]